MLLNIVTHNDLMKHLQFESLTGNSLKYNRENVLPTSAFHQVGDTWSDTQPTFTQRTASLTIVGVQSPLDRYIMATRSSVQSPEGVLRASMAKSLSRKIEQKVIQGEPEAVSTEFEGIDSLCRAETRMMAMDDGNIDGPGTLETELTLDRLDAMIDMIDKMRPSGLMMNKTMRRKLTSLSRATGSGVVTTQIDGFGKQVTLYDGIPIILNDWITDSEQYNDASTWPSSTATSIFAMIFGEADQGYTILHNGPVLEPEWQKLGTKFDANEDAYRMVAYLQAVIFSAKRIAALGGIDSSA